MRSHVRIAIIVGGLAFAAGSAAEPQLSPEERLARLTHNATPGKPQNCISGTMTQDSQTIEGIGIVYRVGRTYYVNRLGGDCPLRRDDILVTNHFGGQFCRGDISRIIDAASRFPKGSCVYGDFVPYVRAK